MTTTVNPSVSFGLYDFCPLVLGYVYLVNKEDRRRGSRIASLKKGHWRSAVTVLFYCEILLARACNQQFRLKSSASVWPPALSFLISCFDTRESVNFQQNLILFNIKLLLIYFEKGYLKIRRLLYFFFFFICNIPNFKLILNDCILLPGSDSNKIKLNCYWNHRYNRKIIFLTWLHPSITLTLNDNHNK